MTHERPSRGRSETSGRRPHERSPEVGRRTPRLVIVVELEELPVVRIDADSAEDQARIVEWGSRSNTARRLGEAVADVLDELRAA
jgi:hypothetical protein